MASVSHPVALFLLSQGQACQFLAQGMAGKPRTRRPQLTGNAVHLRYQLFVTDHNRPVLRIAPVGRGKSVEEAFGALRGKVVFHEDPDRPTEAEWADL